VRALQRGGRLTTLGQAIAEYGRIAKTLHLLHVIEDECYRRQILTQLNRQESRHSLAQDTFHGKKGEPRQPYRDGQEDQLSTLGLVVNPSTIRPGYSPIRRFSHLQAVEFARCRLLKPSVVPTWVIE